MHQAEKTSKEIAETTKSGLRTVQRIIKNWKDGRETIVFEGRNVVGKQSWLIVIGDHFRKN